MWSLKIGKMLQCFIKFICKYSFTYFNFYSPPNVFFITLQQLISSSLIFQFWSNTVLFDFYFKIIYFGSKKQKYIKTPCHFFQWVFSLFILTNFIDVLRQNCIHKYAWKSNVKKVLFTSVMCLLVSIAVQRGKYFAERASICDRHFWCALGQNSWFLVGKLQNFDNFMENSSLVYYWLYLKNDNFKQKSS